VTILIKNNLKPYWFSWALLKSLKIPLGSLTALPPPPYSQVEDRVMASHSISNRNASLLLYIELFNKPIKRADYRPLKFCKLAKLVIALNGERVDGHKFW